MRLDNIHVLIVEDDSFISGLYARQLEELGAQVSWAKNGQEALDTLAAKKIDVVLSDRLMDPVSGDELFAAMQADAKLRSIPRFIISNIELTGEDRKTFDANGMSGYMIKAELSFDELAATVSGAVQKPATE